MADGLAAKLRGVLGIHPLSDSRGGVPKQPGDLWHRDVLLSQLRSHRVPQDVGGDI